MNSQNNEIQDDQEIDLVELCKISEIGIQRHNKTLENPTTLDRSSSPVTIFEDEELSDTRTSKFQFRFGSIKKNK